MILKMIIVHREPYGQKPLVWYDLHMSVLYCSCFLNFQKNYWIRTNLRMTRQMAQLLSRVRELTLLPIATDAWLFEWATQLSFVQWWTRRWCLNSGDGFITDDICGMSSLLPWLLRGDPRWNRSTWSIGYVSGIASHSLDAAFCVVPFWIMAVT